MVTDKGSVLSEMGRASALLSLQDSFRDIIRTLVEQTQDITHSDMTCLFLLETSENRGNRLVPIYRRGRYQPEEELRRDSLLVEFLLECREAVILNERKKSPFLPLLLNGAMNSGMALPLATPDQILGVLIVNSRVGDFYNNARFQFLDSFVRTAAGMLHTAQLTQQMKDYLKEIETLKLYQENVFNSMTNLLITTDKEGQIRYFNEQARRVFGLDDQSLGEKISGVMKTRLSREIFKAMERAERDKTEIMGLEGIMNASPRDIDFSLNIAPLVGKNGRLGGLTLLFTDQSRERELKEQMHVAVEERRQIKDMFSRYLSEDVVHSLMESPDLVKPGGGKKNSTIFFADIRGYTSFSEGKEPEYIIQVLNEYFSEAVDIIIRYRGFIDKFIGDCIMAAWGVPLVTEQEDAVNAVSCALEIQQLVSRKDRKFFTGEASHLKIGIGMHSGPLVAGNLGSLQRMDYSVIGDTVNVAARMESVSRADEVIITESTRTLIGEHFKLEKREPVSVKGKSKPIPIYRVIDRIK